MGEFIWHEWARFVSVFASVYSAWAGLWGVFFRKFFWDFVGGTIAAAPPAASGLKCGVSTVCGIIPGPSAQPFIMIIVNVPVVQLMTTLIALFMISLETMPYLKQTNLHRSFVFKAVMLILQGFLASLFYQGTNGALYSALAAFGYLRAHGRGEYMKEAKETRGTRGGSNV